MSQNVDRLFIGQKTFRDPVEMQSTLAVTGAATFAAGASVTGTVAATSFTGDGSALTGIVSETSHSYASDGTITAANLCVFMGNSNQVTLGASSKYRLARKFVGISAAAESGGVASVYDQIGDVITTSGTAANTVYYAHPTTGALVAASAIDAALAGTLGAKLRVGRTTNTATQFVIDPLLENASPAGAVFHLDCTKTNADGEPEVGNLWQYDRNSAATFWDRGVLRYAGVDIKRLESDSSGNPTGWYLSPARTNEVQFNRDMTNAYWTKSNVTAARTQTGIDGIPNSASLLTATAGNGTCIATATTNLNSKAVPYSFYAKRVTGTGVLEYTLNNGGSYTAFQGSINSSTWTRITVNANEASSQVGFRIVTSGDAVAIDYVQGENLDDALAVASNPIWTPTSAAVTVAADLPFFETPPMGGEFTLAIHAKTIGQASKAIIGLLAGSDILLQAGGAATLTANFGDTPSTSNATIEFGDYRWYVVKCSMSAGTVKVRQINGTTSSATGNFTIADLTSGMDFTKAGDYFALFCEGGGSNGAMGNVKEVLLLNYHIADADETYIVNG